jgi:hypothetical protein
MSVSPFEFPRLIDTEFTPEQALRTPIGALSPLWFAYAGAASAGAAYWWMTRWMRPFNIEARLAPIEAATAVVEDLVEPILAASEKMADEVAEIEPVALEPVAEIHAEIVESLAVEAAPHLEAAHMPQPDTYVAPEVEPEPTEPKAKTKAATRKPATPAAVAAPTTRSAASRRPPRKTAPSAKG